MKAESSTLTRISDPSNGAKDAADTAQERSAGWIKQLMQSHRPAV